jgi:2-C-methyl-D-erythritol 4-phosphate cytidylyltransferase
MSATDVLIMAAGSGERFGGEPKQFLLICDKPVIVWAIESFCDHPDVDAITVVAEPGREREIGELLESYQVDKIEGIVPGGETRQESVRRGLDALRSTSVTVLVHDAARPCLSGVLLQRILDALCGLDAVVPAVPAVDTLIREKSNRLEAVVDRTGISGVQTPQGFRTDLLRRAHANAETKGIKSSDDGSLVLAMGESVATVPGERTNIKITFEEDMAIAEAILASGQMMR